MFSGIFHIQLALLAIGLVVCLPIGFGFVWGGHRLRRFSIMASGRSQADERKGSEGQTSVQIEGRRFTSSAIPPRLDFVVGCRNIPVLGAIALVAIGSVSAALISRSTGEDLDPDNPRYFLFYGLCFLTVALLFPALRWLEESSLMRAPGVTLAAVYRQSQSGLATRWVSYGFTDPQGGHYGGTALDFGGPKGDDLKVVLCNPLNMARNSLSCGLFFHRVEWAGDLNEAGVKRG
jgi:hypothetical protein